MSDPISVSIITPCYNGARFLAATLESVLTLLYYVSLVSGGSRRDD